MERHLIKKTQILSAFSNHFKNRYSLHSNVDSLSASDFVERNIVNKLSNDQKLMLEKQISMNDLSISLMSMKTGKSPASNGFTANFF